jgi:MFS transporter, NNP family, nitrate/nitrite transporter
MVDKSGHSQSSSFPVFPLLFLAAIFYCNFMARIIFGPLLSLLEIDLGLSHSESGSFFLMISLGFSIGLFGIGLLSSRVTHRRIITIGMVILGCSLLIISQANSLGVIVAGLIILGIGAGTYLPSGVATLTALTEPRNWGKAFAIHELAPNTALVTAPLLAEAVIRWSSWRMAPVLLGVGALVFGLSFARFGKGGDFHGEPLDFNSVKTITKIPSFWIMGLLFSLGVGASLGVYSMLSLYLVAERGMDRSMANTLISVSRISGIGLSFLGGWVSDRLGPKMAMSCFFLILGCMTFLLGVVPGNWVILLVFLQPAFSVCFFPAGFSALSLIGPHRMRNITVSMIFLFSVLIGGGALPVILGIAGQEYSFSLGFAFVGLMILASLFLMRRLHLRSPEEEE